MLLVLFAQITWAAIMPNLYQAAVPISSQSERAQQAAAREALEAVLVKVTGERQISSNSAVNRQLARAEELLQQFTFENRERQLYYQAKFDRQKVDDLIQQAGFPIWGNYRPTTLFWLALQEQEGAERQLLGEQTASTLKAAVAEVAAERGIWLNYPLLDIEDVTAVSLYDVWGRFVDNVAQASQRYQVEGVLNARLYPIAELLVDAEANTDVPELLRVEQGQSGWQLDWNYLLDGEIYSGELTGSTPQPLLRELVHQVADTLAKRYAIDPLEQANAGQALQITLLNIRDLDAQVRIDRFLKSLTAVSEATLTKIQGEQLTYSLRLLGSTQDLLDALRLDGRVQRQRDQFGVPVSALEFVWQGS